MRIQTIIVALSVACASQAVSAQPTSGGPVDQAVVENLVAASRILADQGVVAAFDHVSMGASRARVISSTRSTSRTPGFLLSVVALSVC
jgi:hypothetical protein